MSTAKKSGDASDEQTKHQTRKRVSKEIANASAHHHKSQRTHIQLN